MTEEQPKIKKRYESVVSSSVTTEAGQWHISALVAKPVRPHWNDRNNPPNYDTDADHPPPRVSVQAPHDNYDKHMSSHELRALGTQMIAAADFLDSLEKNK